jgi:Endoplasmic reticulum-based factor for assembly of V-ATPase
MTAMYPHVKTWRGVRWTAQLRELYDESLALAKQHPQDEKKDFEEKSFGAEERWNVDALTDSSLAEARTVLLQSQSSQDEMSLPLAILRSISVILGPSRRSELDAALRPTQLVFDARYQASSAESREPQEEEQKGNENEEQQQHRERMARLRLKYEERQYIGLTQNLGLSSNQADDAVTVKSMMYAASIGLNMIIAPISFGVFMYFFAGSLLDYFFPPREKLHYSGPDIKRVIIGVVSGVCMLFVEMILFVIRTHTLDEAVRKKERKHNKTKDKQHQAIVSGANKDAAGVSDGTMKTENLSVPPTPGPFGFYNAVTARSYSDKQSSLASSNAGKKNGFAFQFFSSKQKLKQV